MGRGRLPLFDPLFQKVVDRLRARAAEASRELPIRIGSRAKYYADLRRKAREQQELILTRRRQENSITLRSFHRCDLVPLWEFVHGLPFTTPSLELESQDFRFYLGLNESAGGGELCLHADARRRALSIRGAAARRARAHRQVAERPDRAVLALSCPPWADRDALRQIYTQCRARNEHEGRDAFAVWHIVPLNHGLVCGLHVPWNLSIVTIKLRRKREKVFSEDIALRWPLDYVSHRQAHGSLPTDAKSRP